VVAVVAAVADGAGRYYYQSLRRGSRPPDGISWSALTVPLVVSALSDACVHGPSFFGMIAHEGWSAF
jgi:hypothetical protein